MDREQRLIFFMEKIYVLKDDIYRISISIVPNDKTAEDITQTVLEKAWKGLDTLRDIRKVEPWVKSILRNEIRNHLRIKKREDTHHHNTPVELVSDEELRHDEQGLIDLMLDMETRSYVLQALEMIDERYRRIIRLHLIADLSLKEIAEIEYLNYGSVRVLYSRGIKKLRELYFVLEKGGI